MSAQSGKQQWFELRREETCFGASSANAQSLTGQRTGQMDEYVKQG